MAKEQKKEAGTEQKIKLKYLRKITVKAICGNVKDLLIDAPVSLMKIAGIVKGYTTGKGTYGDNMGFTGEFIAVKTTDGTQYAAPNMFCPPIIAEPLYKQIEQAINEAKEAGEIVTESVKNKGQTTERKIFECNRKVRVGFELFVQKDTCPIGYVYSVEPLTEVRVQDDLKQLMGEIGVK